MTTAPARREDMPLDRSQSEIQPAAGKPDASASLKAAAQAGSVGTANIEQKAVSAAALAGGLSYGFFPGGPGATRHPSGPTVPAADVEFLADEGSGSSAGPVAQAPAGPAPSQPKTLPPETSPPKTSEPKTSEPKASEPKASQSKALVPISFDPHTGMLQRGTREDLVGQRLTEKNGIFIVDQTWKGNFEKVSETFTTLTSWLPILQSSGVGLILTDFALGDQALLHSMVSSAKDPSVSDLNTLLRHSGKKENREARARLRTYIDFLIAAAKGGIQIRATRGLKDHEIKDGVIGFSRAYPDKGKYLILGDATKAGATAKALGLSKFTPNPQKSLAPGLKAYGVKRVAADEYIFDSQVLPYDATPSGKPATDAPGAPAAKTDAAVPEQEPRVDAKLLASIVTDKTDVNGRPRKLTDRAEALANILQPDLTPEKLAGVLAGLSRPELNELLEVSRALKPQDAAAFATVFSAAICKLNYPLIRDLATAFIGGIGIKPSQLAVNLTSLVKAPGFAPELLTDGLRQLVKTNRLGDLKHGLERPAPEDARAVAKALAAAIGMMKISGVPQSTLDGIVNIGSAVLEGLNAHNDGPHKAEIGTAMEQIEKRILQIPPGPAEAKLVAGLHGVTGGKLTPQARADKLAKFVDGLVAARPPVSPGLLASALQRHGANEISNLEQAFPLLDRIAAPLAARIFASAITKMRATDTRKQFASALVKGFPEKEGNNPVKTRADIASANAIANAKGQVSPYLESASEHLADRFRVQGNSARLAEIVKTPGFTPEQLAGAWLKLSDDNLVRFYEAFAALDPKDAPIVASAIAAASREIDGVDGVRLTGAAMAALMTFKGNHANMSVDDRDRIDIAHHQASEHLVEILKGSLISN